VEDTIQFIANYGYLVVLSGVLAEQLGIPLPSNFVLIIAGALAGSGQLDLAFVVLLAVFACLLGNSIWFYIGRKRGFQVLGFLCRISLEPDRCINSSKGVFKRHGAKSLLVAKFIPGFSIFAPPLAGATAMSFRRFIVYDLFGSVFWVGAFAGIGYFFSGRIESIVEYTGSLGIWSGAILILGLALYFGWKILARRRFINGLRVARIEPEELKSLLDASEDIHIVDLRDELDFEANPNMIRTAVRISPDEIEHRHEELPRDRDVILYCT
jgi:membrane protein DedA with SNARE-associated domain